MNTITRFLSLVLACLICFSIIPCTKADQNTSTSSNETKESISDVLTESAVETQKISFAQTEYELYLGSRLNLKAELIDTTKNKTVLVWSTSDDTIAKVTTAGYISPVAAGDVEISCWHKDDEKTRATTILHIFIPVKSVSLSTKTLSLIVGASKEAGTGHLETTILPDDAHIRSVTWSSSNEKVATVDDMGVVYAQGPGQCQIRATSNEPTKQKKFANCTITVSQAVTEVTLPDEVTIAINKVATIMPTILPKTAKNKKLEWASEDESIAIVTAQGGIKGISNGSTLIYARTTDGSNLEAKCKVTVVVPVLALKSVIPSINVPVHKQSEPISLLVSPENASIQTVTWTSSDESIATVNEDGEVTGIKGGTVTITATSDEKPITGNPKSVSIKVTIVEPVSKIALEKKEYRIAKGSTQKLVADVLPESASIKKVTWNSSNPDIVSVNQTGYLTAKKVGTATITCEATDGSDACASCDVTVYQRVTGLTLSTTQRVLITKGKTKNLSATVFPKDATNKKLKWSSSNTYVASVGDYGTLTANHVGECVITVSTTDGSNISKKFNICVEPICPITIEEISTYWIYTPHVYCLFVVPYNSCKYRTVKTFTFWAKTYNYLGTCTDYSTYEWSGGGFKQIGPGRYGNSGSWHWYNCYSFFGSSYAKAEFAVTSVTYADGYTEYIPASGQIVTTFQ